MIEVAVMPETKAYQILTDLEVQGKLSESVQAGIVKPRHAKYFYIYQAYRRARKSRFKTKAMCVIDVCHEMNVGRSEVWEAIRFMEI